MDPPTLAALVRFEAALYRFMKVNVHCVLIQLAAIFNLSQGIDDAMLQASTTLETQASTDSTVHPCTAARPVVQNVWSVCAVLVRSSTKRLNSSGWCPEVFLSED